MILGETRETQIALQNLRPDWYRANIKPWLSARPRKPFFWPWRPGDYPNEVGFGWITKEPQPSNQRRNGMMQITIAVNGIA